MCFLSLVPLRPSRLRETCDVCTAAAPRLLVCWCPTFSVQTPLLLLLGKMFPLLWILQTFQDCLKSISLLRLLESLSLCWSGLSTVDWLPPCKAWVVTTSSFTCILSLVPRPPSSQRLHWARTTHLLPLQPWLLLTGARLVTGCLGTVRIHWWAFPLYYICLSGLICDEALEQAVASGGRTRRHCREDRMPEPHWLEGERWPGSHTQILGRALILQSRGRISSGAVSWCNDDFQGLHTIWE